MSKVLSHKVSDEHYMEIRRAMNEMGFRNVSEFLSAIISMSIKQWERIKKKQKGEQQEPDEIDEMFKELEDWQSPKYGNKCKQTRTPIQEKTKL